MVHDLTLEVGDIRSPPTIFLISSSVPVEVESLGLFRGFISTFNFLFFSSASAKLIQHLS